MSRMPRRSSRSPPGRRSTASRSRCAASASRSTRSWCRCSTAPAPPRALRRFACRAGAARPRRCCSLLAASAARAAVVRRASRGCTGARRASPRRVVARLPDPGVDAPAELLPGRARARPRHARTSPSRSRILLGDVWSCSAPASPSGGCPGSHVALAAAALGNLAQLALAGAGPLPGRPRPQGRDFRWRPRAPADADHPAMARRRRCSGSSPASLRSCGGPARAPRPSRALLGPAIGRAALARLPEDDHARAGAGRTRGATSRRSSARPASLAAEGFALGGRLRDRRDAAARTCACCARGPRLVRRDPRARRRRASGSTSCGSMPTARA